MRHIVSHCHGLLTDNNKVIQVMIQHTLHFLLLPDSSAARYLKRKLASSGGCRGVIVGTWPELLSQVASAYLLPAVDDGDQQLRQVLPSLTEAFWARSYAVAPQETATAVLRALRELVAACEPLNLERPAGVSELPGRTRRHIDDLFELIRQAGGALPDDLVATAACLRADAAKALRLIHVYHDPALQTLDRWQAALIAKLNADSRSAEDPGYAQWLAGMLHAEPAAAPQRAIARLQADLFGAVGNAASQDDSVQWVGVRDALEEVEVVAGMVQSILNTHSDVSPSDIAVMLPERFEYNLALGEVFPKAGLSLSGLPLDTWQRDLGTEAVFHFLYCRDRPAPAMAIAACLSSPLMPWPASDGAQMAQRVMDGDYKLDAPPGASAEAKLMLSLLKGEDETPASLQQALRQFVDLLKTADVDPVHIDQAHVAMESVLGLLEPGSSIPWEALRRVVVPSMIRPEGVIDYTLEGVTVWREGHEPWRAARYLFVLGFSEGHYPGQPAVSPVFAFDDYDAIRNHCGLPIRSPDQKLDAARARLKRQLRAASDHITWMVPRRSADGESINPSDTLVFMQQLFGEENLIREVSASEDRALINHLPSVETSLPVQPREIEVSDLDFDDNLLALRKGADGELRPESPSSLDTLMISPLAWLLRRLHAEPVVWAPETPNVAILGTLAHSVFEELFQPEKPLPRDDEIETQVPLILNDSIKQRTPFLRAPQWQVERRNLASDIVKAAIAWRDIIRHSGADIIGVEVWLKGHLNDVPVRGAADLLIRDKGNRLLVIDYKRASSGKRRLRMKAGYDFQTSLYRRMIETGGTRGGEKIDLGDHQPGIVYYMLQDQMALSDTPIESAEPLPRWEWIQEDTSSEAIRLIEKRLKEVQAGVVRLNRDNDADFFNKEANATPYALENSPLISRFTLPSAQEG